MRPLAALVLLVSAVAVADVLWGQGGATSVPVRQVSCHADGGLLCPRNASTHIGDVYCNAASATEPGCVTPSAQTYAGDKTNTGNVRIVGHAHASLTACDANHKGTWQTCTDHNAPVFCDGTNNRELIGTSGAEQVLGVIPVNGIPVSFMGGAFQTPTSTTTVTAIEGSWFAGSTSDGGTVLINLKDSGATCTCTVPCANTTVRILCSGNCTNLGALTLVTSSTTCTTNPYVAGDLVVKGILQ